MACASQMHSSRGWDYLKENNNQAAISEFNAAIQESPLPGSYAGLYKAYMNMNDYGHAWQALEEGLKKFPDDKFLNFAAGDYQLKITKNYSSSIHYLNKAKEKLSNPTIDKSLEEAEHLKAEAEKNK